MRRQALQTGRLSAEAGLLQEGTGRAAGSANNVGSPPQWPAQSPAQPLLLDLSLKPPAQPVLTQGP